jgi:hypothetical protein
MRQQEQAEELSKPQNEDGGALIRASILRALKDHYGDEVVITLKDNRKHQEREGEKNPTFASERSERIPRTAEPWRPE